jgi:hypothetical protein
MPGCVPGIFVSAYVSILVSLLSWVRSLDVADEPLKGFGERIVARARVPVTTMLALPFIAIVIEYFFFLVETGASWTTAIEQIKKDVALFIFLGALPPIVLAFSRELQVHDLLDKIFGTRSAVGTRIADLMAQLADSSGYGNSDRIRNNPEIAAEWFYLYANQQTVLRSYAFELWESYYVVTCSP